MSCEFDLYECTMCGTQFENGVADPGPAGEPRCPQCLFTEARRITIEEMDEFVVMRQMPFR